MSIHFIKGNTLRARSLQAQIYNITARMYKNIKPENQDDKIKILKVRYENVSLAAKIASETEGFNSFLKTMFIHNKASLEMTLLEEGVNVATPEEIRKQFQIVLADMKKEGYNHFYHGLFAINIASFEYKQGNTQAALESLDHADLVNKKFAASTLDLQKSAKTLRDEISKGQKESKTDSKQDDKKDDKQDVKSDKK